MWKSTQRSHSNVVRKGLCSPPPGLSPPPKISALLPSSTSLLPLPRGPLGLAGSALDLELCRKGEAPGLVHYSVPPLPGLLRCLIISPEHTPSRTHMKYTNIPQSGCRVSLPSTPHPVSHPLHPLVLPLFLSL